MELSTVISIGGMLMTALLAYWGAQKGITVKLASLETKVDELSARVEKHNNMVERTIRLEEEMRSFRERLDKMEAKA